MRKKITFLSPEGKAGPYFVYRNIVNFFQLRYSDIFEVSFYNSKLSWIGLHFSKNDIIFSSVPFLFKPLRTKKFIYNPRGNFEKEKHERGLGRKLLYLSEWNLRFSDAIWLVSYFLADVIGFGEKYSSKILILPNFINRDIPVLENKLYTSDVYKILTFTSFSFYTKGKGVLDIAKVIFQLGQKTDRKIIWTIIGNDDSENFSKIKQEFDTISFPHTVQIIWKGWCDKQEIYKQLEIHDYFLYWTYLDNFPGVILDAIAYKLKILVNDFESFPYFLPQDCICSSQQDMLEKVLNDKGVVLSPQDYSMERTMKKLYDFCSL